MTVTHSKPSEGVSLIQLSGKSASQSFSRETLPKISEAIISELEDVNVKAIVITGEGRFFSAGADINSFQRAIENREAPNLIRDLTDVLHPLLMKIRVSPKIVIAAVNGAAAGGGLGLALACDSRVASVSAKFAAAYASLGLSPDGGTTWLLPRLIGESRARRFFLSNEILTAKEAHQLGVVDHLVEDKELIETSIALAESWSGWSPHMIESTKHLLHVQNENDFDTHLKHEQTLIEAAGLTQEFKEGVKKFLSK